MQHRPKACFVLNLIGKIEIRLPRPGAFIVTLGMDPIVEPVVGGTERLVAPVMDGNGCRAARELGRPYLVLTDLLIGEMEIAGCRRPGFRSRRRPGLGRIVIPAIGRSAVSGDGMETGRRVANSAPRSS